MDFVDLDKVLDEFEEEEKQALSIIPGQELRPSGYLEFLEKHQEQEWALINPSKFSSNSGYTLERRSAREPANVSYDDPYDSLPAYKFGCVTTDQLSSVPYMRYASLPEGKQRRNQSAIVTSLTRISVHNEDVNTVYTTPTKVYERKGIANCSERKGTIAYHPIEVQTDALSPASEKELMSSPFPKSDILVDGHGDTSVLAEQVCYSEIEQNQSPVHSGADKPEGEKEIKQSARVSIHIEDENQRLHPATRNSRVDEESDPAVQPNLYSLPGAYNKISSEFPVSEIVDTVPNSTSLYDIRSSVVSAGETNTGHLQSEQIVCFNDLVDEDFDNEEINLYLNELQGQRVMNVDTSETSAPVRLVESVTTGKPYGGFPEKNTSHDIGNSISDEEFNARSISQVEPGDRSISAFESSYRNTHIHTIDSDDLYSESYDRRTSDVDYNVKSISDIEPYNHPHDASETLYNSLIKGKLEIENILDDINKTESATNNIRDNLAPEMMENANVETTSCVDNVSEQVLCGRMEIENILDEVILKQRSMLENATPGGKISQSMDFNSSHRHSNIEHGSDNIEDSPCETALTAGDSASSSPARSIGQNYDIESSVQTIGVGARPKDLSALKKNRPNASFGSSKGSSEIPAEGRQKVTADVEDNTFHKQMVDQISDSSMGSSMEFHQPADDEHQNAILVQSESLDHAEVRPNNSSAVEPEDKPVLHDFSEPCSQSVNGHANDQSLAETDGLDTSQVAGTLKRPTSLDLPSQPEDAVGQEEDVGHAASVETTELTEEGTAETKSVMHASDLQDNLGHVAPFWIPDTDALTCMICQTKFTIWKRRHHCRACGKVLCTVCCNQKAVLPYMENKEARVCIECHIQLNLVPGSGTSPRYPNPNNPFEYCSKVPPSQQVSNHANPPVVMVPAGVLRSSGGQKRFGEPKQVMFSDGVRPGGDLAKLDESQQAGQPPETSRAAKPSHQQQAHKLKSDGLTRNQSLIPGDGLPPLLVRRDTDSVETDTPAVQTDHVPDFKSEEGPLVMFTLNRNLAVGVKIINLDCCLNRTCWCFVTRGMDTVGESELVVLLELTEQELADPSPRPTRDMFLHLQALYEEALKGDVIKDMGHFIFHRSDLGTTDYSGFFFLRPTFQCLNKIPLPQSPYMFSILIQKYELPWARVFPLRLMLRLGAEFKYYPCPLISIRDRKPVFFDIGHTIINLLADFRSYQYMLPQIKGLTIHMENKKTVISLPRNHYNDIMKAVRNSNEHVMALGSSFSTEADSHLVCIQSDDGNYQTQAINIQDKPRLVTGASFVVFNGALKLSSGLRAKSSIVEDGLMVQVLPDALASIKEAIKNSADYTIQCGLLDAATSEEVVELRWVDHDRNFNIGVKSYIDGTSLEAADMMTIKPPVDYTGETLAIRWTRVYFLQSQNSSRHSDSINMNQLMEDIAHACCSALVKYLEELKEEGRVKLGLRVNLTRDSIGYEIGSQGQSLPVALLNSLDTFLIPVIHLALLEGVLMEFVFNIVE